MTLKRRTRRSITAFFGVLCLLFAQLAVSAYACPMLSGSMAVERADAVAQNVASVATPCIAADMYQPALCEKHCQDGQQNVNDSPFHPASLDFSPGFVVTLVVADPAALPGAFESSLLLHAASPPLTIRNCCLRI